MISAWKEKIEIARGNGGDIKKELSRQYREASDAGKDALEDISRRLWKGSIQLTLKKIKRLFINMSYLQEK